MDRSSQQTIHIINRVFLRPLTAKTTYEVWNCRKLKLSYLHVFDNKCYILKDRDQLDKFDARSDEGLLLGYSTNSHAFLAFKKIIDVVMESVNITVEDVEHNWECSKDTTIEHVDDTSNTEVEQGDKSKTS